MAEKNNNLYLGFPARLVIPVSDNHAYNSKQMSADDHRLELRHQIKRSDKLARAITTFHQYYYLTSRHENRASLTTSEEDDELTLCCSCLSCLSWLWMSTSLGSTSSTVVQHTLSQRNTVQNTECVCVCVCVWVGGCVCV